MTARQKFAQEFYMVKKILFSIFVQFPENPVRSVYPEQL